MIKVLIIGLGSIALKHIQVLRKIENTIEIYALRSSKKSKKYKNIIDLYSFDVVKKLKFNFAIISSPTIKHWEDIKRLSTLNIPLMVEKPIFYNMEQINSFERMKNKPMIYVACNFRFHPLVNFVKKYLERNPSNINEVTAYCGSYLPDWRPNKDYRTIYSANKKLGGGVHLDLIHEPDYLIYLLGHPLSVDKKHRKVSNLEIDTFDSAAYFFEYKDFQAQIKLNYYRKDTKRTLEIVRENDTIKVDFINNSVKELVSGGTLFRDENYSIYDSYRDQMQYFISCIKENKEPMNSAKEAIKILKTIL